jgi:N-acetylglucosamine-6-phosphate deacetylase
MNQAAISPRPIQTDHQRQSHWRNVLDADGMYAARLAHEGSGWREWAIAGRSADREPTLPAEGYLTPLLPIEFHCHGLRGMDFSNFQNLDLARADEAARLEGVLCVLTMFLPQSDLERFGCFMQAYDSYREAHPDTHLAGVALEGPLLASVGGTPEQGNWSPSRDAWQQIASWGACGLKYVVLSPDAFLRGSCLAERASESPAIEEIVTLLLTHAVTPALGHFQRSDPTASADSAATVIAVAQRYGKRVLTDHLFNDMPLNFRHAWRTAAERSERDTRALARELQTWTPDNLASKLGPVPATLIHAAREGSAILCVNFDGDHVDHMICERLQALVSKDKLIAMTDRIETPTLAGSMLTRSTTNSLWYRPNGTTVAAGTTSIDHAMHHLREMGTDERTIWHLASIVPSEALGLNVPEIFAPPATDSRYSCVDARGTRHYPLPDRIPHHDGGTTT